MTAASSTATLIDTVSGEGPDAYFAVIRAAYLERRFGVGFAQ